MKIKLLFLLFLISFVITAQKKVELENLKYSRSSLHTILIETPKIPFKEVVTNAYFTAPFPEKYNNHQLEERSFNPVKFAVTDQERAEAGLKERGAKATLNDTLKLREEEIPIKIRKY